MGTYITSRDTKPPSIHNLPADLLAVVDTSILLQGWSTSSIAQGTTTPIAHRNGDIISVAGSGSGIQLRGNAANVDHNIIVDGKPVSHYSPSTGVPADLSGLAEGAHTHSLTARISSFPDSSVSTSDDLLSSNIFSRAAVVTTQPVDDKDIAFRGEWSFVNDQAGFNSSYHISKNTGDLAMLQFTGSGVAVSGFANSTSGSFNATLDGQTTILNSKAPYSQSTVLFFQTGLDPSKRHTLLITNSADSLLAIGTIDVTTVSGGEASSGLSRGAIAGIAVVSVLGFFLLLTALVTLLLRRHGRQSPFPGVNIRIGRMFAKSSLPHDVESNFDGEPISFTRHEKKGPVEAFSPVVPLPRPPRKYAPKDQRASVTWRDSLINQPDTYTVPTKRPTDKRRGSKTLLLGETQASIPYLTFGRSDNPPADIRSSVIPYLTEDAVLDIRAPSSARVPVQHAPEQSFLDITSSGSPSSKHQSFPSSTSSERVNRGSHRSKSQRPKSRPPSGSSALGNSVLRSLFPRSLRVSTGRQESTSGSGSAPSSFPYPFVAQGHHGSVPDSPVDQHAQGMASHRESMPRTVSDIYFRPSDDITSDGLQTRPTSMPAPPQPHTAVDGPPVSSPVIVQRFLGMWGQAPRSADAYAPNFPGPPPPAYPPPWPRSPVSPTSQAWVASPRTSAPAGPRPLSMARR